jgi:hypothetical protein
MIKVGGEVDAFCTRCELTLAHTVHAMLGTKPVKVECNTCHGVHRYRDGGEQRPSRPVGTSARAVCARAGVVAFDALLAAKRVGEARPYSARGRYAVDEVIDHPTFGRGFVSAIRDAGKIEVTFRSEVRVLVHGRD